MNTQLLLLQAHARFANPSGVPADFNLSTIAWDAAGNLVSELPTSLLRKLVLLYSQYRSLNAHVVTFGEALGDRDLQLKGSNERSTAEDLLASIVDVFNTGIDSALERGQEIIPALADMALVKETEEQKKQVIDYASQAAGLVAERQARIAEFKRRFRPDGQ